VDDFFISVTHALIFLVAQNQILIAALGYESEARVFRRIAATPIGIDPSLSSLVQLRGGEFVLASYAEPGARAHMAANPTIAAQLLHGKSPARLAHVLALVINDGLYHEGIAVMRLISGVDLDDVLPLALKDIEKPWRQEIFEEFGRPLEYFCRVTGAFRAENGEFIGEIVAKPESALALLGLLAEEEGPVIGLFGALFCLQKLSGDDSAVPALLPSLAPLKGEPTTIARNAVLCAGIKMKAGEWAKLRRLFEEAVGHCLEERLLGLRLQAFMDLAEWAGVGIGSFLSAHGEIEQKVEGEALAGLAGTMPSAVRQALEQAHWDSWSRALAGTPA
jgi:hypothetical protein